MPSLSAPNQGRAQALLGSSILFLVLPYPFVFLRFWARRIKKTPLAFNDYALFLALLFTSGYNVAIIMASIKGGYGQHMWTLSIEEITANLKVTVAVTFLWPTANSLVKISVLSFYKNVFYSQGRTMLLSIYALGALTLLYWGSTVIVAFALCRPFAYNWNKFTIQGTCGDQPAYYLSTGIVNLLIDVMIVALPLPCLWNLHMALSRKLSLMVIFSLGALICVLSIVRVVAISKLDFADATYNIVLDNIMSALEPTLGVINACLPLLQPIIPKVSETKIVTWFRSLTTLRSSGTGLSKTVSKQPSGESKSHHFERLTPDLYPLSDFSTTQRSLDSTIA